MSVVFNSAHLNHVRELLNAANAQRLMSKILINFSSVCFFPFSVSKAPQVI